MGRAKPQGQQQDLYRAGEDVEAQPTLLPVWICEGLDFRRKCPIQDVQVGGGMASTCIRVCARC